MNLPVRRFALFRGILGVLVFAGGSTMSAQSIATVGELLAGVLDEPAGLHYLVIPVAGHVDGANETEFRTDITILTTGLRRVAVAWLAQGVDSSSQPVDFVEVGSHPAFFADMVARTLQKTGLGALVFAVVAPDGSLDSSARIAGYARVWTPVPGCSGTSSLAVEPTRFEREFSTVATGLRLDAGHRGTIGVVNPGTETRSFEVHSGGADPLEISVPPASMIQIPMPQVDAGPLAVYFLGEHWKAAYATSVDQASGDGWFVSLSKAF